MGSLGSGLGLGVVAAVFVACAAASFFWAFQGEQQRDGDIVTMPDMLRRSVSAALLVVALNFLMPLIELPTNFRGRLNLLRQTQHVSTGVFVLVAIALLPDRVSQYALAMAIIGLSCICLMRMWFPEVNRQYLESFGKLLRDREKEGFRPPAAWYFLLGCWLSMVLFPWRLGVFCIASLTFADPMAATGGVFFGGPRLLGEKTCGGFLTCSTVGAIVALFTLRGDSSLASLEAADVLPLMTCGLAVGIAELAGGLSALVDDNLTASFGAGALVCAFDSALHLKGRLAW